MQTARELLCLAGAGCVVSLIESVHTCGGVAPTQANSVVWAEGLFSSGSTGGASVPSAVRVPLLPVSGGGEGAWLGPHVRA